MKALTPAECRVGMQVVWRCYDSEWPVEPGRRGVITDLTSRLISVRTLDDRPWVDGGSSSTCMWYPHRFRAVIPHQEDAA